MRCPDLPQCSPQIGRLVSAGQPCDHWVGVAGETRDGAAEHVSFSSCYVHVSPDLFFSVSPFLFWYCLWFPVVTCQFCLSQRCMTETDNWSSVSSFNRLCPAFCMLITCFFLTQFIFFPFQLSVTKVINGLKCFIVQMDSCQQSIRLL